MAPSFNTDTPVDWELKPKMFWEMFNLLNINVEEWERMVEFIKRES